MFDIGWQELFLVALVAIIVVGPKELPRVLRTVTLWIRKIRTMAREFQDGLEDLARETEIDQLRQDIEQSATVDLESEIGQTIDPAGEVEESIQEIGGALRDEPAKSEGGGRSRTTPDSEAAEATTPDSASRDTDKTAGGVG